MSTRRPPRASRAALLLPSLALALACPRAPAATHRVPADFATVAAGLAAAAPGDTVLLAEGSYEAWGLEMRSGVCLRGAGEGPAGVSINGGHVSHILAGGDLDERTLVEGITFLNARSGAGGAVQLYGRSRVTFRRCRFQENQGDYTGGAVACWDSSPLFEECAFADNHCRYGSPYDLEGGGAMLLVNSDARLLRCVFTENFCFAGEGKGGAIFSVGSALSLDGCEFRANRSLDGGGVCAVLSSVEIAGGLFFMNRALTGGGLSSTDSRVTMRGAVFDANHAAADGGGLRSVKDELLLLKDCAFADNQAAGNGAGLAIQAGQPSLAECRLEWNAATRDGGGAWFLSCAPALSGCRIASNAAGGYGGGVALRSCDGGEIAGCVVAGNSAATGGGLCLAASSTSLRELTVAANLAGVGAGAALLDSRPAVARTLVAFNRVGEAIYCPGAAPALECTDIFGNARGDWTGTIAPALGTAGNFAADPLFCDAFAHDFMLHPASPCLPGGRPPGGGCERVGALGLGRCSATAASPTTWGLLKAALAGP